MDWVRGSLRVCTGLDQRRGHSSLSISRHVKEEEVIGSSHHRFSKSKSHLTNLTAFCAEVTGSVDEWWAVDIVHLDFSKFCTWDGMMPCTGWELTTWGAVLLKNCSRIWGPCWTQSWL